MFPKKHAIDCGEEIHLAVVNLDACGNEDELGREPLNLSLERFSESERARLTAMVGPMRRRQFIASHHLVRTLLDLHRETPANDWSIVSDDGQPPRLAGEDSTRIHLAIAHSAGFIACAVATAPIGLDIEAVRPRRDPRSLAHNALSEGEFQIWERLTAEDRLAYFYQRWTLKEAWTKRVGAGLAIGGLTAIDFDEVSTGPGDAFTEQTETYALALVSTAIPDKVEFSGEVSARALRFWRFAQP